MYIICTLHVMYITCNISTSILISSLTNAGITGNLMINLYRRTGANHDPNSQVQLVLIDVYTEIGISRAFIRYLGPVLQRVAIDQSKVLQSITICSLLSLMYIM